MPARSNVPARVTGTTGNPHPKKATHTATPTPPHAKPYATSCAKPGRTKPVYVYRGTRTEPAPEPVKKPRHEFDPDRCGTYAGYKQHQRKQVPSCDDCRKVAADYMRNRYKPKGRPPVQCGTPNGYVRHKRHNEDPCAPCIREYLAYRRTIWAAYRERKKNNA
jgi:hypothetical protein